MNKVQIWLGIVCLIVGVLFYLMMRPQGSIYFLPFVIGTFSDPSQRLGGWGDHFPTFVHVFSFSLLTAGVLGCERRGARVVCLGWFLIELAFELGQQLEISRWIVVRVPALFQNLPVAERAKAYFLQGTFDELDLLSIALGSLAAYVLLVITEQKRGN